MYMLTYNQWKNSVVGDFSHAERIGEDLILLKGAELMQKELGPFHTDMTIAIILNEGSLKINIDMTDYEAASPCMVIIMHKQTFKVTELEILSSCRTDSRMNCSMNIQLSASFGKTLS